MNRLLIYSFVQQSMEASNTPGLVLVASGDSLLLLRATLSGMTYYRFFTP